MSRRPVRPRGRRPQGGPDTRELVLAAARELFAERGYERTTMREIARRAEVDPALIYHFFDNKDGLLSAVLVPSEAARHLLASGVVDDPARAGVQFVARVIGLWDSDADLRDQMVAMIRTGLSHEAGAALIGNQQRFLVTSALGEVVSSDRRELRLSLVIMHMAGLLVTRYLVRAPAVVALSAQDLASTVGPVFQHYLTGSLPASVSS